VSTAAGNDADGRMMSGGRQVVELVPVGTVPDEVLDHLLQAIEARFPRSVARLASHSLMPPEDAYDPARRQYRAEPILARLDELPTRAERVLGVADLDLYEPGLNFIFGQAHVGGRVAVVALARLRPEFWGRPPDQRRFLERAAKEAIHELGHAYGLSHCPNSICVMHFSNTLEETDRKSDRFCGVHEADLLRIVQRD